MYPPPLFLELLLFSIISQDSFFNPLILGYSHLSFTLFLEGVNDKLFYNLSSFPNDNLFVSLLNVLPLLLNSLLEFLFLSLRL